MSIILNVNGTGYPFPEENDEVWGPDVTDWAQAVTVGMLQKVGGEFILLGEVDFGGSFGLKSIYFKSSSNDVASSGQLRLARTDSVAFRNEANDADLLLAVDVDGKLMFNGALLGTATEISNADIASNAAIALTKLQNIEGVSIAGRSPNSSGPISEIAASTNGFVLRRASNALSFGLLINENIDTGAAIDVSKLNGTGSDNYVLTIESNVAVWKAIPAIANGAVTEEKIANGAVSVNKLSNSSVTTDKVVNSAITTDKINALAVTNDKIENTTIAGTKLVNSTLTRTQINEGVFSAELLTASGTYNVDYNVVSKFNKTIIAVTGNANIYLPVLPAPINKEIMIINMSGSARTVTVQNSGGAILNLGSISNNNARDIIWGNGVFFALPAQAITVSV